MERYNVAIEGERLTREQWFDAAHSVRVFLRRYCIYTRTYPTQQVLNDIELLCGECQETCSGCCAPDVLLEHIRIYHNLISNVSSLRFLMSCKERQRRSTGRKRV